MSSLESRGISGEDVSFSESLATVSAAKDFSFSLRPDLSLALAFLSSFFSAFFASFSAAFSAAFFAFSDLSSSCFLSRVKMLLKFGAAGFSCFGGVGEIREEGGKCDADDWGRVPIGAWVGDLVVDGKSGISPINKSS